MTPEDMLRALNRRYSVWLQRDGTGYRLTLVRQPMSPSLGAISERTGRTAAEAIENAWFSPHVLRDWQAEIPERTP